MSFSVGEVYTLKINSGEELVAKVVDVHSDFIQVSEPVSVAPGPPGHGFGTQPVYRRSRQTHHYKYSQHLDARAHR